MREGIRCGDRDDGGIRVVTTKVDARENTINIREGESEYGLGFRVRVRVRFRVRV